MIFSSWLLANIWGTEPSRATTGDKDEAENGEPPGKRPSKLVYTSGPARPLQV